MPRNTTTVKITVTSLHSTIWRSRSVNDHPGKAWPCSCQVTITGQIQRNRWHSSQHWRCLLMVSSVKMVEVFFRLVSFIWTWRMSLSTWRMSLSTIIFRTSKIVQGSEEDNTCQANPIHSGSITVWCTRFCYRTNLVMSFFVFFPFWVTVNEWWKFPVNFHQLGKTLRK